MDPQNFVDYQKFPKTKNSVQNQKFIIFGNPHFLWIHKILWITNNSDVDGPSLRPGWALSEAGTMAGADPPSAWLVPGKRLRTTWFEAQMAQAQLGPGPGVGCALAQEMSSLAWASWVAVAVGAAGCLAAVPRLGLWRSWACVGQSCSLRRRAWEWGRAWPVGEAELPSRAPGLGL